MEKKKRMEEKWRIVRWLTTYIEENQERWDIQKRERDEEFRRRISEWDMSERFRKIEMIRKREIEEKRSEKMENGETENQSWLWKAWRAGEESDPKNKNTEIQTQKPNILEFERDTKEKISKARAKKGPAELDDQVGEGWYFRPQIVGEGRYARPQHVWEMRKVRPK